MTRIKVKSHHERFLDIYNFILFIDDRILDIFYRLYFQKNTVIYKYKYKHNILQILL